MKRLCVFCGSSLGVNSAYAEAATTLGTLLAARGIGLVYGGGNVGLMGVIADAALAGDGEEIGVIPRALADREIAHTGCTELRVVDSMHTRKAVMADLADAFVALPGGIGTLEEFFETWTWAQLGVHAKPIGLLDVAGFWGPLTGLLDHLQAEGFLRGTPRQSLLVHGEAGVMLESLAAFTPPRVRPWLRLRET